MPNVISVPNLLSLLEIDYSDTAARLCIEAEGLRRKFSYEEAITVINEAIVLAQDNKKVLGVTLLYASAIHLSTGAAYLSDSLRDHEKQSIKHCDRAIAALRSMPFNYAIAQALRAKLETQLEEIYSRANMLVHVDRARKILEETAEYFQRKMDPKRSATLSTLSDNLAVYLQALSKPTSDSKATSKTKPPAPSKSDKPRALVLGDLPVSTRLPWFSDPVADGPKFRFILDDGASEVIDATYLLIEGGLYVPHPLSTEFQKDRYLLSRLRQYFILPITEDKKQYVLVCEQERPDQKKQLIVVAEDARREMWIDEADSRPSFEHIHVTGADRVWDVRPPGIHILGGTGFRLVGVVEAVLLPAQHPVNLGSAKLRAADLSSVGLPEANLVGADLREANLEGANLNSAYLNGACLIEAILQNTTLIGASLDNVDLDEAKCENANFDEAQLNEAVMYIASLENAQFNKATLRCAFICGANLRGAKLRGADLRGANLEGADFTDADLTGARLERAQLAGANLSGTQLRKVRFCATNLENTIISSTTSLEPDAKRILDAANLKSPTTASAIHGPLANAILRKVNFANLDLTRLDFMEANLADAILRNARLRNASFEEANLESVDLYGADLRFANLRSAYLGRANLRAANLSNANLTNAYLRDADLRDAVLYNADLSRAILIGVKNLSTTQINQAASLSGAIMPDGTIRP